MREGSPRPTMAVSEKTETVLLMSARYNMGCVSFERFVLGLPTLGFCSHVPTLSIGTLTQLLAQLNRLFHSLDNAAKILAMRKNHVSRAPLPSETPLFIQKRTKIPNISNISRLPVVPTLLISSTNRQIPRYLSERLHVSFTFEQHEHHCLVNGTCPVFFVPLPCPPLSTCEQEIGTRVFGSEWSSPDHDNFEARWCTRRRGARRSRPEDNDEGGICKRERGAETRMEHQVVSR